MKILILGKSGVGKSNFADILKNYIFETDKNSVILIDDPDRANKKLGSGNDEHKIKVKKLEDGNENIAEYDIVVNIQSEKFKEWFDKN
jgi:CO dehydrogenase nickel-insertion accessory protein CooC1